MTNLEYLKDVGTSKQRKSIIYNVWKNENYSYGRLTERDITRGYVEFLPNRKIYLSDGKNRSTFNISEMKIEGEEIIFDIKEFLFGVTGSIIIQKNDDISNTQIAVVRKYVKGGVLVFFVNDKL